MDIGREELWAAYDAYAKAENGITFLLSDLEIMRDYLHINPPPLPQSLVRQFATNLTAFKQDAEKLRKDFGFPLCAETANMLWEEVDPHSHRTLGHLIRDSAYNYLGKALTLWGKEQEGVFEEWKKRGRRETPGLSSLNHEVMKRMNELIQQIEKRAS